MITKTLSHFKSALSLKTLGVAVLLTAGFAQISMAEDHKDAQSKSHIGQKAEAEILNNSGDVIGKAKFIQGAEGVLVKVKVSGLPAGKRGMHFHEVGTCEDHDHFKMAKGHIMPSGRPHGYLNTDGGPHEGNLPNLIVHEDGTAHVELYTELVSVKGWNNLPALLDDNGSTLMIHENEDDHISQPIGGSGGRIACGVIHKVDAKKAKGDSKHGKDHSKDHGKAHEHQHDHGHDHGHDH